MTKPPTRLFAVALAIVLFVASMPDVSGQSTSERHVYVTVLDKDGTPVSGAFARTNGCEISRWDALAPLLGSGGEA